MGASVVCGLERLLDEEIDRIAGKRIGLIANPTSVDRSLRHAVDLLHQRPEVRLAVLFGPEHGLRATAQDLIEVGDATDSRTALPIRSLYGPNRVPTPEMLEGLDAVVFDIQDVGSRYYTYVWTMAHAMEACARDGIEAVVLDRPNPIGGVQVEGNLIEASHLSFVGLYSLPNRHGMTAGEIARLVNEEYGIDCRLTVIPMSGWRRSQWFDETDLPWVLPSPNMPTIATATVYPGACLIEGTNLSEGRGTTRPFEIMGAPWIDGEKLARELQKEDLPGVIFRPLSFEPTFQKFRGNLCGGIQQHVVDRAAYRPVRTGYALIRCAHRLWPKEFAWRPPPYEYELERPALDILAGNGRIRELIDDDRPLSEIEGSWQVDLGHFKKVRDRYLLYD
ncbi:MAG: exo-beta-N-acetylmuramidase NamZ family protein [Vicinamibacteria bacterium]